MNSNVKIAVLCSHKMAIPALLGMIETNTVKAIGITEQHADFVQQIKAIANKYQIRLTVFTKNNFEFQLTEWLTAERYELVFVISFPWRIPVSVLNMPNQGFLNCHYGLLPQMKGADPVFECIMRRITTTGVTIHKMDAELDGGPILAKESININAEITYGILSHSLSLLCNKMCRQIIDAVKINTLLVFTPQTAAESNYWHKRKPGEIKITWGHMDATEIIALVKACNPIIKGVPAILNKWVLGVCDCKEIAITGDATQFKPGTILAIDEKNGLLVLTKDSKAVNLEVVYTEEGTFPGYKLAMFGVCAGMMFE